MARVSVPCSDAEMQRWLAASQRSGASWPEWVKAALDEAAGEPEEVSSAVPIVRGVGSTENAF
jgi:hypothetical protein